MVIFHDPGYDQSWRPFRMCGFWKLRPAESTLYHPGGIPVPQSWVETSYKFVYQNFQWNLSHWSYSETWVSVILRNSLPWFIYCLVQNHWTQWGVKIPTSGIRLPHFKSYLYYCLILNKSFLYFYVSVSLSIKWG